MHVKQRKVSIEERQQNLKKKKTYIFQDENVHQNKSLPLTLNMI